MRGSLDGPAVPRWRAFPQRCGSRRLPLIRRLRRHLLPEREKDIWDAAYEADIVGGRSRVSQGGATMGGFQVSASRTLRVAAALAWVAGGDFIRSMAALETWRGSSSK